MTISWRRVSTVAVALMALGSAPAAQRPNIVFVYADDHAQRAVGAYGSPLAQTPHIDRLAAEGLRFTNSFVGNSICGPARATVLTGLHAHAHGKTTNGAGFDDSLPTWPALLQASGYRTAVVGKWHLGPQPRGFDHWLLARGGYYNPKLVTAEGSSPSDGYTTELLTTEALRWIAEQAAPSESEGEGEARPFAIWICHAAAHRTWMPGPTYHDHHSEGPIPEPASLFDDYAGRSAGAAAAQMRIARDLFPAYDLKLPVTGEGILDARAGQMLAGLTQAQREAWDAAYGPRNAAFERARLEGDDLVRWKYQRYIGDYLRCVDALDDSLGRVLAALDEAGLSENTVVIYSSDQGFFLGEHGWYDKRWMYEPSLRTPLIVRWPGVTDPGAEVDALVQNIDMAPTLLGLAGLQPPDSMHGESLLPFLQGRPAPSWRDAIYYHYHQRDSGRTAHTVARHYGVRTRRHKLIHVYDHDAWELYDLQEDPEELHNLHGTRPELEAELRGRLAELRELSGDDTGAPL